MKKELYSMKCPGRIVFGDPLYFEEYKGKRLAELVVDFKSPANFSARLALEEKELKEYPGFMDRTMTFIWLPNRRWQPMWMDICTKGRKRLKKQSGLTRPNI